MKTIFFKAFLFVTSIIILPIGCKDKSEPVPVTSLAQFDAMSVKDEISNIAAKITSTVISTGNGKITDHGHVWAETKGPTIENGSENHLGNLAGSAPIKYSSEINSLKANRVYFVRPYATNEQGTAYGQEIEIRTYQDPTTAVLDAVSSIKDITDVSFNVTSTIKTNGDTPITEHGFYYSINNKKPGAADEVIKLGNKSGDFPLTFTSPVTIPNYYQSRTYYISPYVTNAIGTTIGEPVMVLLNGFGEGFQIIKPGYGAKGGEAVGDYDGDGKADIAKHVGYDWYIDYAKNGFGVWDESLTGGYSDFQGVEVPGDYDGDGKTDIAIHYALGAWNIFYAKGGWVTNYGLHSGYGPLGGEAQADYDGDKKTDIAIYDYKNDKFMIDYANDGFKGWNQIIAINTPGANIVYGVAFPGDYNGDGKADIAIMTNPSGWFIDYNTDSYVSGITWDVKFEYGGNGFGNIAAGDFDGDKKTDIARATNSGQWGILYAKDSFNKTKAGSFSHSDGKGSYNNPLQCADYDGDGKTDLGVHAGDGRWLIDLWDNHWKD